MIQLVHVRNPLMPSASRETHQLARVEDGSMERYIGEIFVDVRDVVASFNGHVIPPDMWCAMIPRDGDCIVVAPAIEGGGLWRTLAQVAVLAAAVTVGFVTAGAGFALLGLAPGITAGLLSGAVSMAGNTLISTFMGTSPNQKAQSPSYAFDGPRSLARSGTVIPKGYGTFMSGGNIIASFVDVEGQDQYINALVCFGFGPARKISNIQINGKDIGTYRNVAYYTRLGSNDQLPIPQFNRIVNGYPQSIQVTCAGGPVVVPGTGDQTQAIQVDIVFPTGVFYTSGHGNNLPCAVIYKVEYSPSGLNQWQGVLQPKDTHDIVKYHTDGSVDTSQTPIWVVIPNFMAHGSGVVLSTDSNASAHYAGESWNETMSVTTYHADGSHSTISKTFSGEWQLCDPTLNQVAVDSWTDGYIRYVNDTAETVYNRTSIYGLAPGKYDVRVSKFGSNNADNSVQFGDFDSPRRGQEVWIHSINEITYQDLAYPNMVLLGVRALATNQIQGANLNITAIIEYGLRTKDNNVLPGALQAFEEDNPACVAADMMLDDLYGGGSYPGILPPNIERYIDEWVAWAELNDELVDDGSGNNIRRAVFNGIFDNEDNLWNQVNAVARMSRAAIVPMGRDYGVFVDKADTPVQMFTMGNIAQDSFQETWMNIDDRADQIEIQIADRTRFYRQDNPIVYMDPADMAAGVEIKPVRVSGKGVTIPAQAWHLGRWHSLGNKLQLRTGQFHADIDAIACRPGNLIILQHDVPQWGWGGRLLAGNSTTKLNVDRNDLPWDGSTAYNVIVLFPSIQRYAGNVTAVAPVLDATGLNIGTSVGVSNFDGNNRITRAVINGVDCAITSSQVGEIVVQPPPGFTPAVGQAYTLYDTDVLETARVSGVAEGSNGTQILTLGTPFSQAPEDHSTYFYGPPGGQKIVRVTSIRKASEFRAVIEWIDYDPNKYVDAVPTVGEASAVVKTNPNVTNLQAIESFTLEQSGSYADFVTLTWKNGPNTAGVGIYGSYPGGATKMMDRLTGPHTSWKMQVAPGVAWTLTVVGFDASDNYAAFSTAPTVTLTTEGIAKNLLQDSSFQTGFAYWNVQPRAGDSFIPSLDDDGKADYTINGSALTATTVIANQEVSSKQWAIGDTLLLSAYMETGGTPTGTFSASVGALDASGNLLASSSAALTMNGTAQTLERVVAAPLTIPAGTASVFVSIGFDGPNLSLPIGSILTVSHQLLEIAQPGQTVPSVWADLDSKGNVLSLFGLGSSSRLRTQGSTVPTFTGAISFAYTDSSITLTWTGLIIQWPDGSLTYVQDGSLAITGLTASTSYRVYLYFDVIYGDVAPAIPATPVGTPAVLSTSPDAIADSSCKQDGRVALTPGGILIATGATGTSGGGSGGGSLPPKSPPPPIYTCTLRGTPLATPDGDIDNQVLKDRFDAGEPVYLVTRSGPGRVKRMRWANVSHYQHIEIDGLEPFNCSDSCTLLAKEIGQHRWCSLIRSGLRVDTIHGWRVMHRRRVDTPGEVLVVELEGPDHEYLVLGAWTHNTFKNIPA